MEILALGCKNFTLGFQLCGIKKTEVVTSETFLNTFENGVSSDEYGVIIVENEFYKQIPARVKEKLEKAVSPIVVDLAYEKTQTSDLRTMIKKAFGLDLMEEKHK